MINAKDALKDGFATLYGGMDSGRAANQIGEDQVAFAINCIFRGGYVGTRAGFDLIELIFDSPESQEWFETYNIQGSTYYDGSPISPMLVVAIGGKLFRIIPEGRIGRVMDITPPTGRSSQFQKQVFFAQAAEFLVIQDGEMFPVIFDGVTSRRAGPTEVPIGTYMTFGMGRLWVGRGREFVAGDIQGGPTSVLSFTENIYLAEGGAFSLPINMGNITGMTFIATQDTATGQGELLVFGENGVVSVNASLNREDWKNQQIQRITLIDIGCVGGGSIAKINGDVFFRSRDGIRSYRAARQEQLAWGQTPISKEVTRILLQDTQRLLKFCQAIYFNNRYIMTTLPVPRPNSVIHRGVVSIDFDLAGSMREKSPTAYDGLWTGIRPVAMAAGRFFNDERGFAFTRDEDGKNRLWELTKEDHFDNQITRIRATIETRAFSYRNPFSLKKLHRSDIWMKDLVGQVDWILQWRPDAENCWQDWHTFTRCANYQICDNEEESETCSLKNLRTQYRPQELSPAPPDICDVVTGKPYRMGYEFQQRITWTGHAKINQFLQHSQDLQETYLGDCR